MRKLWILTPVVLVLAASVACGETETNTPEPAPAEPEVVEEPAPDLGFKVLAPSPLDLETQVKEAGLLDKLEIPEPKTTFDDPENKDRVAFQTGMLFAYTVLGGREAEKDAFIAQAKALREGMALIGTGKGWLATMDDAISQVENDMASREDVLQELDDHVGMHVPEEGWGPDDTTGPMLQAGAWLAGMEIVARAAAEAGDGEAADKVLKRPDVADFFLKYIEEGEGADKAGMMAGTVAKSLAELKAVAERDSIGVEGAKEVATITGELIKKF